MTSSSQFKEDNIRFLLGLQEECNKRKELQRHLYDLADSSGFCFATFDGWSCWNTTPAGETAVEPCPAFVTGFDRKRYAFRRCLENGTWFRHPDTGQPWSNYTTCVDMEDFQFRKIVNIIYVVGYSVSFAAIILSLIIFLTFRSLRCTRIAIHVQLFSSFALNDLMWIIWYKMVVGNTTVVQENKQSGVHSRSNVRFENKDPDQAEKVDIEKHGIYSKCVKFYSEKFREQFGERDYEVRGLWFGARGTVPLRTLKWFDSIGIDLNTETTLKLMCQALHVLLQYLMVANYLWMFCEGLHLHLALVVVFVKDDSAMRWFYFIGWVLPGLLATVYASVRLNYPEETGQCWMNESHTQWILTVPVLLSLLGSLGFLVNVVRVLLTKLHCNSANPAPIGLRKAVRAALILVPLFGIHHILIPFRPEPGAPGEQVYQVFSALLVSLQGFCVSLLFCFANVDVHAAFKAMVRRIRRRATDNGNLTATQTREVV